MKQRPVVPASAFRVEGHCCAIVIPGIREGDTPVDFTGQSDVRRWLAQTYGMEGTDSGAEAAAPPSAAEPEPSGGER